MQSSLDFTLTYRSGQSLLRAYPSLYFGSVVGETDGDTDGLNVGTDVGNFVGLNVGAADVGLDVFGCATVFPCGACDGAVCCT